MVVHCLSERYTITGTKHREELCLCQAGSWAAECNRNAVPDTFTEPSPDFRYENTRVFGQRKSDPGAGTGIILHASHFTYNGYFLHIWQKSTSGGKANAGLPEQIPGMASCPGPVMLVSNCGNWFYRGLESLPVQEK